MKRIIKLLRPFFIIIIVVLGGLSYSSAEAAKEDEDKNVLIINSYHQGLAWTREETNGIIDTFAGSDKNINIDVEYMDWKNHPTDKNLHYLYQYYEYKYQNKKLDLIIATDDIALQFSLENRRKLFSDAPVIFCGVNEDGAEKITKSYNRVTGVIEVVDATETIALARQINPSLKNIYLLYDRTESGLTTGKLIIDKVEAENPDLIIHPMNNMPYDVIIDKVKLFKSDSIILITTYSRDVNYKMLDMFYAHKEISANSSVPVYSIYDFGLNSGVVGGVMLSGRKQGENAATLALRIFDGENIANLPFFVPNSMRAAVDYKALKHFDIPLNKIPKNFEVINKPFSFFETYKTLIIGVISVITVLILFINILIFYIRRINRMKKELSESHEELTQLYEELTASDEEMKQQYEEILSINEKIRLGEEKLTFLAYHDSLTSLPNKLSLFQAAKRIFVPENGAAALLFLDIDNFKNVNDTLGHDYGDLLVKKVSERLTSFFDNNDSIYRLGGDEFIILLQQINNAEEVLQIAEKLQSGFSTEFDIDGSLLQISLSIGIAMYPEHGTSIDQLLKYADIAMYRVKATGKKNYIIYNKSLNELFLEQVNMEKCMPKALERGEFEIYYQPQVDLTSNKITGFEALLRWHSTEFGEISPIKFIKIAEDSRFIITLGKWVLQKACEFLKRVHNLGYTDLMISVNISIIQLLQSDFCNIIFETLKDTGLAADYLELEITESVLIESIDQIGTELNTLYESRIKIALDDFGKGYSSLNYLRQLPISTLKLDKSFIDSILYDSDHKLTGQIVSLGKSMGMTTIAEGVETQEQLEYLTHCNCDKFQGFLYSRPQPEREIIKLLKQ